MRLANHFSETNAPHQFEGDGVKRQQIRLLQSSDSGFEIESTIIGRKKNRTVIFARGGKCSEVIHSMILAIDRWLKIVGKIQLDLSMRCHVRVDTSFSI